MDGSSAVEQLPLQPGDRVRLDPDGRRWWTVQAVSEHFAACVRQAAFEPAGVLEYTVLAWRNGVRGPCNLIGQGFGDGTYSPDECAEMLSLFEGPRPDEDGVGAELEVSQRNWVPLNVTARREADTEGSASSQHYIDTGLYLLPGEEIR